MTFSGASESDQESIISMSTAGSDHMEEEEIDESLLDDNEEEPADGAEKDKEMETCNTGKDDSTKEVAHNAGSVGSLATSFMLNVTVGSNDIFAQPKIDSRATSVVGSSHAGKLSALVSASLETKFLKLPSQSQTPDAAEDLVDKLSQLGLIKDDIVYLDLLSNLVYLGTDQDGIPKKM